MSKSTIGIKEVAAALHMSTREVIRLAEAEIIPGRRVRGQWEFHPGEIRNWIDANLQSLPERRAKDRHPHSPTDLLLAPALHPDAIRVGLLAKTKSSVLRELAKLAVCADETLDEAILYKSLAEREAIGSTALQNGVAVPHPSAPMYSAGPVIAAARTAEGIVFGESRGGLSDLFFLICCPRQIDHLLYLGRLCRLLIDPKLQGTLREATDERAFINAILSAEARLCSTA